jgi:hypothetical protein
MTNPDLVFIPETCEHGVKDFRKSFGAKSVSPGSYDPSKPINREVHPDHPDYNFPNIIHFNECRDSQKSMRPHIVDPRWPADDSRYSDYEIARGAGQRKPRSDIGVKRGPRKAA